MHLVTLISYENVNNSRTAAQLSLSHSAQQSAQLRKISKMKNVHSAYVFIEFLTFINYQQSNLWSKRKRKFLEKMPEERYLLA